MPQIICDIDLDVSVKDNGQKLMAKAGDRRSRLLRVRLLDCGKHLPIGRRDTALLNVAAGEEKGSYEGEVTEDGNALFVIPDLALQQMGTATCDVSVLSADGGRLTSSSFQIIVEDSVFPAGDLGPISTPGLAEAFVATQKIFHLQPEAKNDGFVLRPEVNRKYSMNLTNHTIYAPNGTWRTFTLELPEPSNGVGENRITICCHAPLSSLGKGVPLIFDSGCLFEDGVKPVITKGDFNLICTYSPVASEWQISVVQYAKA